jgi:HAMP domain-containing protein
MATLNRYEDVAAAFLAEFPIGTVVGAEEIDKFANDRKDGLAADLLVDDVTRRISSVRRHLNSGASSRSFAESDRYYIDVEDAKNKTFVVKALAAHVFAKAELAFSKSVTGALSPLKLAQRELENTKTRELTPEQRAAFEAKCEEIIETMQPIKQVLGEQTIERFTKRLVAQGYSKQQARDLVELLPQLKREMRLIAATR